MDPGPSMPPIHAEYFVLRRGEFVGPMTTDELRAAVTAGRVEPTDLAQLGDTPMWRPVASVLATDVRAPEPAEGKATEAASWREVFAVATERLKLDVDRGTLATAAVFIALGLAMWALVRWPLALCLPFFVPPVVAGVLALTRGKVGRGAMLLLGVAAVTALCSRFPRKTAAPTPATAVAPAKPAISKPLATPTPSALPVAVLPLPATPPPATPAPVVAKVTEAPRPVAVPAPLAAQPPAPKVESPPMPDAPVAPGDFVKTYSQAFVVVKGDAGNGSGFICRLNGKPWLFTNNHVVAGNRQPHFTQINGTRLGVAGPESAAGHDLMRFALVTPTAAPLEVMAGLDANARIGDEVAVLGNTGGGGVVTSIEGKLVGIGPDRIEVSAEFIPGNSGSPIVHVASGKVIGIATYLTKRYEEFVGTSRGNREGEIVVRRFGYRLDTVPQWEPVNWAVFQNESDQLKRISQLTGDVFDFLEALREKKQPQFATDTLRRPATEWVGKMGKGRLSDADRRSATQSFLGSLRTMVHGDVVAAEGKIHYTFFRDELTKEREIRDKLFKAFDDDMKQISSTAGRPGY